VPRPRDSLPRNLDSLVYGQPPRRDTGKTSVFPRDTLRPIRRDSIGRRDTVARPDTLLRRPRPVRPDTDTVRVRIDTVKHETPQRP
jgi:hypothetical protein